MGSASGLHVLLIRKKIVDEERSKIPFTLGVDMVLDLDFLDVGSV